MLNRAFVSKQEVVKANQSSKPRIIRPVGAYDEPAKEAGQAARQYHLATEFVAQRHHVRLQCRRQVCAPVLAFVMIHDDR